ncbi:PREDICTED: tubulin polymerization-promoting protein family member 2-like [Amphimedon queenslandica]|uniref:EF-hand domain-containing protein n=1 Tax=Amphimedon queenslandica TaxID=400682 RepID=A0A1X7VED0_AMPQE|nr:PREDICTED: tubulin polymerization-promoting protein family member 2-like [Amphimedon queenslandica]|eukprot:XP_003384590.1 PREDICTED: tubulin polymerization-promoting protein family member 2-like [Amphimedon queenslandica]
MASAKTSLEDVFQSFCSFGEGLKGSAAMDNAKFAKLTRDVKILDKKLTSTDVDIIFSKVKAKTDRKINFEQFKEAVRLMADKKYPGDPDGERKLIDKITAGSGPKVQGVTKTVDSPLLERMTDTSKYTGTHKERFDESGKGKGLAGRDSFQKGAGMAPDGFSGNASYVHGYKHEGTYDKKVKK